MIPIVTMKCWADDGSRGQQTGLEDLFYKVLGNGAMLIVSDAAPQSDRSNHAENPFLVD